MEMCVGGNMLQPVPENPNRTLFTVRILKIPEKNEETRIPEPGLGTQKPEPETRNSKPEA
jgi:hypothetical protein